MAKSPEEMAASMVANMPDNTGKSLDAWLAIVKKSSHEKHGQIVKALKADHGIGHGYANLIAHHALKSAAGGGEPDLVEAQYAGAKASLRPMYDKLVTAVTQFGKDMELAPKKTYVSLRRSKQFGLIQSSTKTRVDVGINLKGAKPTQRLEASGTFNGMVSHRVRLGSVDDIDAELIGWLKEAYDAAK